MNNTNELNEQTEDDVMKEISLSEAAKRLRVHPDTLRNWCRLKKVRCIKHPYSFYYLFTEELIQEIKRKIMLRWGENNDNY